MQNGIHRVAVQQFVRQTAETDGQGGVEISHHVFHIQQKHHPPLQPDHAGDGAVAHVLQKIPRFFHIIPTQPMNAVDSGHHETRDNVVELGDDDFRVVIGFCFLAKITRQVHQGHDLAVAVRERAHDGGMAHLRHGGSRLHADDFHHLGHVDAVVSPVVGLIEEKLDDFQFVGAGFQKNVGLSHVPLAIRQPVVAGLRKRPVLETGLYDRTPPIDAS